MCIMLMLWNVTKIICNIFDIVCPLIKRFHKLLTILFDVVGETTTFIVTTNPIDCMLLGVQATAALGFFSAFKLLIVDSEDSDSLL